MQEEQNISKMFFEGKEFCAVPENIEKTQSGYAPSYCTICSKEIDKYGRRKEEFKKSGWVFCPKHGWVKEGVHMKEMDLEKPLRLSIEEIQEDQDEHEKSTKKDEVKILPEIETDEESLMQEEKQQEIEFPGKGQLQTTYLSAKTTKTKFTSNGIIVLVIFFFIIVCSLFGYFVWKGSSKEVVGIESTQVLTRNKKLTIPRDQSKVSDMSQESISQKRSAVGISNVSASEQTVPEEKIITKIPQTQEPVITAYSVQIGAFSNISNARLLQDRLDKKGYHCYISPLNTNGEVKLNRVLIGNFSSKKKAEAFSKKITKAENLQTFVTLRGSNI